MSLTLVQMRRGEGRDGPDGPVGPGPWRRWPSSAWPGWPAPSTLTYTSAGTSAFDYRGGFLLSALSAAAIIIGAVCVPGGPIARVLSFGPWCGSAPSPTAPTCGTTRSTSYLDSARTGLTGLSLLAVRFGATFALAAASYYLVERPVMYGMFWRSLRAAGPAVVLMVATVAVVVAGTVAPATAAVRVDDVMPTAERQALTAAGAFTTHPVRFLLVGDSLAFTLAVGLNVAVRHQVRRPSHRQDRARLRPRRSAGHRRRQCRPTRSRPARHWRTLWRDQVAQYRPDVVGLLIGRWDITDHLDNGTVVHIGQPAWDAHLAQEIDQAVSILSSQGAKVVLFTMPYIDPPRTEPDGAIYPENSPARVTEFNQILAGVAERRSKVVTVIDLNKMLDPHGHFQSVIDGVTVRWADGIHISEPGGEWLQPAILPTVGQLGLAARANQAPR